MSGTTEDGAAIALSLPLIAFGEPIGAISLYKMIPRGEFGQNTMLKLRTLSSSVASRIQACLLRAMAITDALTGLFTRGHFFALAKKAVDGGPRGTLILLDIDHSSGGYPMRCAVPYRPAPSPAATAGRNSSRSCPVAPGRPATRPQTPSARRSRA